MTAATAELCGHRWRADGAHHYCTEPAIHADPCPCPAGTCTVHCAQPPVHRCVCRAITREGER